MTPPPLPERLPESPLPLFEQWIEEAMASLRAATAMALATVAADGRPAARMVLCRGWDLDAGWLGFYTDRDSPKGEDLARDPRAALVFYWEPFARQVRLEGPVTLAPDADSDAYWITRPVDACVAAVASEQSRPIASRTALLARVDEAARGIGGAVPRPARWGGYRVWIERMELWVSQPARIHDRARWSRKLTRAGDGYAGGPWSATRLQP